MNTYRVENRDLFIECHVSVTVEIMGDVYLLTPSGEPEKVENPQLGPDDVVQDQIPAPQQTHRKIMISSGSTSNWSFAFQRHSDEHGWGPDEPSAVGTSTTVTKWRVHASRGNDNFYSAPFSIEAVAPVHSEPPSPTGPR